MTMHLAQGMTTICNRKYKPKYTKVNIAKWEKGLIDHNRQCKRIGEPKMTFEQYVDYCHGIRPKIDPRSRQAFKSMDTSTQNSAYRETKHYPSAMEEQMKAGTFNTDSMSKGTKKEPMMYTGDLITGIATMHKSNAVPVMKGTTQAVDIARMRR
jgi:hypothetical protein